MDFNEIKIVLLRIRCTKMTVVVVVATITSTQLYIRTLREFLHVCLIVCRSDFVKNNNNNDMCELTSIFFTFSIV